MKKKKVKIIIIRPHISRDHCPFFPVELADGERGEKGESLLSLTEERGEGPFL